MILNYPLRTNSVKFTFVIVSNAINIYYCIIVKQEPLIKEIFQKKYVLFSFSVNFLPETRA